MKKRISKSRYTKAWDYCVLRKYSSPVGSSARKFWNDLARGIYLGYYYIQQGESLEAYE